MKCWFFITLLLPQVMGRGQVLHWADRYDVIRPSATHFIVTKKGKMGVTDRAGRLLTKLDYDTIFNFREGVAIVGRGRRSVNQFGKVLSDFKYGYLDESGREIVPTAFAHVEDFSEGLGLMAHPYGVMHPVKYQYVNRGGNVALRWYDYLALPFAGGMAYVTTDHGFWLPPYVGEDYPKRSQKIDINDNFVYGNYIDHTGKTLIPARYDSIAPYTPGYLRPVRKDGKWGFLDAQAREAIPLRYDDVDEDSLYFWGRLRRVGAGGRYGFMDDRNGRLVLPLRYTATLPSQRNVAWVQQGDRWGLIDTTGRVWAPFRYQQARPFDAEGRAVAQRRGHFGLVRIDGREASMFVYQQLGPFLEGRAAVQRAGRFGFLDTLGREVIPAQYDAVSPFRDGQAYAKRWGMLLTLDAAGRWQGVALQNETWSWALVAGLAGVLGWYFRRRWWPW